MALITNKEIENTLKLNYKLCEQFVILPVKIPTNCFVDKLILSFIKILLQMICFFKMGNVVVLCKVKLIPLMSKFVSRRFSISETINRLEIRVLE